MLTTTAEIDARIRRLFPFALTRDQDRAVADLLETMFQRRDEQFILRVRMGTMQRFHGRGQQLHLGERPDPRRGRFNVIE